MSGLERTMRAVLLAAVTMAAACGRGDADARQANAAGDVDPNWSPAALTEVRGVPVAQVKSALTTRLGEGRPTVLDEDQWGHTQRLYKMFGGSPLWLAKDGLHEERARALTDAILRANEDGMRLDAYRAGDVARSLVALRQNRQPTAEQLADVDMLLTSTYVALAEDLLTGQIEPKSVSQSWFIDPQDERIDSALVRALRESPLDSSINRMRPQDEEYAALRAELKKLRELTVAGGWSKVPEGRALKPGESDTPARIEALRKRLAAEGLLGGTRDSGLGTRSRAKRDSSAAGASSPESRVPSPAVYDRTLAAAVAAFQAHHGIPVDSVLGEGTVKSLNVPASYRLGQVAANLERHRWLPRTLGARYILVNVPAFRVEAWDSTGKALEMKVIVGQEYEGRATPVFSDSMEMVVFRPYWNVTPDIQAKEIEPKIASDPGYMERGNYEYYQEGGKTRIRQRPGGKNSLGLVKFLFPNDFNIYLHDTPQDDLFEKDVRAFSHGCIRLEKPAELAQWVLGWDAARVHEAMENGGDNRTIKLPKKIPVYIAYFTAYLRDGQLYFGNDLYDRDDALVRAVGEGALPTTRTVQAIEALQRIATKS